MRKRLLRKSIPKITQYTSDPQAEKHAHEDDTSTGHSLNEIERLQKLAAQGNSFAQYRLGKLYLLGEDVPKDVDAAIRWLTASAEQGNQYAQYALGKLYLAGRDVPRDREAAVRWLTRPPEQGNVYAQFFLDHRTPSEIRRFSSRRQGFCII